MKILIVEDNEEKLSDLTQTVGAAEFSDVVVEFAKDIKSAKRKLSATTYDLLLLDILLPAEPSASPNTNAAELIRELNFTRALKKPRFIIGITAYEEAFRMANDTFQQSLWWLIRYDAASDLWRQQLANKVRYLRDQLHADVAQIGSFQFDVACVTALHSPELQMLKAWQGVNWDSQLVSGDSTEYLVANIAANPRELKIVAASCHQMGLSSAAVLCSKLIFNFRPRFLIMAGIAAGYRGRTSYGDILVAEHSWDYNSGKLSSNSDGSDFFKPDPKSIELHASLRDLFARLSSSRRYLDEIREMWKGPKPGTALQLHLGPVVSGSAVVENEALLQKVSMQNRKIIGLDMETYSVFLSACNASKPRPVPLSIKAVCDFADSTKDDSYQAYAAFASAEYVFRFVRYELGAILHSI